MTTRTVDLAVFAALVTAVVSRWIGVIGTQWRLRTQQSYIPVDGEKGPPHLDIRMIQRVKWREGISILDGDSPSTCKWVLVGSLRLIFWYLLQPITYTVAFIVHYDSISHTQRVLGAIVLARELLSLVMTLGTMWAHPSFLLINFFASGTLSKSFLTISFFTLMPDRTVVRVVVNGSLIGKVTRALFPILDLCSIIAFIVGCQARNFPLIFALSYGLTVAAAVLFVAAACYSIIPAETRR
eukprot:c16096_g1_i1.p1 GENE.c16096_g1_i1~~c16096_g1_i1.p1  ORF type:complete len:240 (+),score=33.27 c16096_g1_i1:34-753(+)